MYKDDWYKINKKIDLSIPIVERKNVYLEISKVISFLNDLENASYFFSCGTALGLVREGKLLDWDTDVDIDVLEPTELIINNIIENMQALGYSYQRVLKSKKRYSQIVFIKAPYHSIDFCFWYKEKNVFINDVPETNVFKRSHPFEIYNEFKNIKIQNIEFKIPSNIGSYFSLLYGSDWQTPKKYKNWLKNANDLKIETNILNLFRKLVWKTNYTYKRVKYRYL
jgi:phosphorylcholine metabolism protein LicD